MRASCLGYNVNLFFSDEKSDQLFAQSICHSCPVRQECESSGDAGDFKDGVRAGHLPGTFKGAPRRVNPFQVVIDTKSEDAMKKNGDILPSSMKLRNKDWSFRLGTNCKAGHLFTTATLDGYGRCRTCARLRRKKAGDIIGS
jgi:hypothetical protein